MSLLPQFTATVYKSDLCLLLSVSLHGLPVYAVATFQPYLLLKTLLKS